MWYVQAFLPWHQQMTSVTGYLFIKSDSIQICQLYMYIFFLQLVGRDHDHKTFEYILCIRTPIMSIQNKVVIWCSILIGCFLREWIHTLPLAHTFYNCEAISPSQQSLIYQQPGRSSHPKIDVIKQWNTHAKIIVFLFTLCQNISKSRIHKLFSNRKLYFESAIQ